MTRRAGRYMSVPTVGCMIVVHGIYIPGITCMPDSAVLYTGREEKERYRLELMAYQVPGRPHQAARGILIILYW